MGAEVLAAAAAAGAWGLASAELKGWATPGLEVAAGAPVLLRGVAVVLVSVVVGVERRAGVVVRVRAVGWVVRRVVGVRRERRVRQRLQIMLEWRWRCLYWCCDSGLGRECGGRVSWRFGLAQCPYCELIRAGLRLA